MFGKWGRCTHSIHPILKLQDSATSKEKESLSLIAERHFQQTFYSGNKEVVKHIIEQMAQSFQEKDREITKNTIKNTYGNCGIVEKFANDFYNSLQDHLEKNKTTIRGFADNFIKNNLEKASKIYHSNISDNSNISDKGR